MFRIRLRGTRKVKNRKFFSVFQSKLEIDRLGIACAIGLHNIPEGFAVAFPIMIGTGSKRKAMFYAGITGFAEPLGALIGWAMFGDNSSASQS